MKKPDKDTLRRRMLTAIIIIAFLAFSPRLMLILVAGVWALCTKYPSGYVYLEVMLFATVVRLIYKSVKRSKKTKKAK